MTAKLDETAIRADIIRLRKINDTPGRMLTRAQMNRLLARLVDLHTITGVWWGR